MARKAAPAIETTQQDTRDVTIHHGMRVSGTFGPYTSYDVSITINVPVPVELLGDKSALFTRLGEISDMEVEYVQNQINDMCVAQGLPPTFVENSDAGTSTQSAVKATATALSAQNGIDSLLEAI